MGRVEQCAQRCAPCVSLVCTLRVPHVHLMHPERTCEAAVGWYCISSNCIYLVAITVIQLHINMHIVIEGGVLLAIVSQYYLLRALAIETYTHVYICTCTLII